MALPVNVGDSITFQHFGAVRPGRVVRITPTVVVVEWTARAPHRGPDPRATETRTQEN